MSGADDRFLSELVEEPREALDVEVKDWLDLDDKSHQATLAKEIIALANHGGGYIVIGFREEKGRFSSSSLAPTDLNGWSQDRVQGVVDRYLDPPIQCRVILRSSPATGLDHPIIIVPGGERVPIVGKKGSPDNASLVASKVYIRRPGPNSEEPRSPEEWNNLFDRILRNRKTELMDAFRVLLSGALPSAAQGAKLKTKSEELTEFITDAGTKWRSLTDGLEADAPAKMPFGFYDMAFAIDGPFEEVSLADLKSRVSSAVKNHSGWPPFLTLSRRPYEPYPLDGAVQAWIGPDGKSRDDAAHSDFWRISPKGFLFARRGYVEDGDASKETPGEAFDFIYAVRRLGEGILNATYIAEALGATDADLICRVRWTGLRGRRLVAQNRIPPSRDYRSVQSDIQVEERVAVSAVQDVLPELVERLLVPVYELFDFFVISSPLVAKELKELTSHTFAV